MRGRMSPFTSTDHTVFSAKNFDFALQGHATGAKPERNRWALAWLLGLFLLLVGAVVALVLYLQTFEAEEEDRRRSADVQSIEQSVQFHFRRLEDDMATLARLATAQQQSPGASPQSAVALRSGLLWRERGVVLAHGWVPVRQAQDFGASPKRWQADWDAHASNAEALSMMRDVSRGLRRSAYAGPMRKADGSLTDVVWLSVPFFERGSFVGSYLAALSIERAAQVLVPDWFEQTQTVRLLADDTEHALAPPEHDGPIFRASMNLPGTDMFLEVSPRSAQPATVPRMFFLVALLFLLGMLLSLYALRRDFVKRQRIQARLQSEVALRSAMENSVAIGLRAWDLEGKILYVNDTFCRMVGYEPQALVGQSAPLPYWPLEQANALERLHRNIIAGGTRSGGAEAQFQHRDGHLVDVLIHETPLNTADGEQIGWMSSVQDISERKRAQRVAAVQQEKLEASGRLVAVGEVASTLAHELNQPLGALSSFATGLLNRLRAGTIAPDEVAPVIARMAGLAEKAGRIIQHVNAFARRRELSKQRLDLAALVRRVVDTGAELQAAPLVLVLGPQPLWIEADEMLLEHLISNLVGNALDWAHQGTQVPRVQVTLQAEPQPEQGMAILSVADSGPGVAPEDQAHIFDAFFSTKEGGMGMGLAICRSIAEAHHGRIEVARDAALGGARFTVRLPLAPITTQVTSP